MLPRAHNVLWAIVPQDAVENACGTMANAQGLLGLLLVVEATRQKIVADAQMEMVPRGVVVIAIGRPTKMEASAKLQEGVHFLTVLTLTLKRTAMME